MNSRSMLHLCLPRSIDVCQYARSSLALCEASGIARDMLWSIIWGAVRFKAPHRGRATSGMPDESRHVAVCLPRQIHVIHMRACLRRLMTSPVLPVLSL